MPNTETIEYRIDSYPSKQGVTTKEGYLKVSGCVAVAGVLEYLYDGGEVVRELVPPQTLRDDLNIKSMNMLPYCNLHPPVPVVAENWHLYAKGAVVPGAQYNESLNRVDADFIVYDAQAIIDIKENGHNELSMGYEVGIDKTPGVDPVFGPYDQIQIWRNNNHAAGVPEARAGSEASFNIDSTDTMPARRCATLVRRLDAAQPTPKDNTMSEQEKAQMEIDGVKWNFTPAQANAINFKFKNDEADLKKMRTEMDAYKKDVEAAMMERDAAQAKVDEMMKVVEDLKQMMAMEGMDPDAMMDPDKKDIKGPADMPLASKEDEGYNDLMDGFGEDMYEYAEDAAEAQRKMEEKIQKQVQERTELVAVATSMGFKKDSMDKASNAAIKKAIVARRLGAHEVKEATAQRIDAMYVVVKKSQEASAMSYDAFNVDSGNKPKRLGTDEEREAKAQQEYEDRLYGRSPKG